MVARNHTLLRYVVMAVVIFSSISLFSQDKNGTLQGKGPTIDRMLMNGTLGREFWFCLPLNDSYEQPDRGREVYIGSSRKARVRFEIPGLGYVKNFIVDSMKVKVLSTIISGDNLLEVGGDAEYEQILQGRAFHITSDVPVSVYCLNGKQVTADGYMAIPQQSWGKDYIHVGYWDCNEARPWGSGFAVIAGEDETQVDISLRGINSNKAGKTKGGRDIGQFIKITLNKGDVYMVQGNARSLGQFDLTGTRIKSNKPIGVISYHNRTFIPISDGSNSRDHLVEMMPPVSSWGKKYISVEYQRRNKGDMYCIVASQPNTRWRAAWYDKNSGMPLGNKSGTLIKESDFTRFEEGASATSISARGTVVFTADKPVFVMQYSYSSGWDGDSRFDPFMCDLVPQEQYTKATIFQTPSNSAYNTNYLNLLAEADTNDPNLTSLKSVEIDGIKVATLQPSFLARRIPGTNVHWATIPMKGGSHKIFGQAPFGGYIYGYSSVDSYGWPAATAYRNLSVWDTLPPVINKVEKCGDFFFRGTEVRKFPINDTLNQEDVGVREIEFWDDPTTFKDDNDNYNYYIAIDSVNKKVVSDSVNLPTDNAITDVVWRLMVVDRTKDAFARIIVRDGADNYVIDSVVWKATKLEVTPNPIDFAKVRFGKTIEKIVLVKNVGEQAVTFKSIKFKDGKNFAYLKPEFKDTLIQPGQVLEITLSYSPSREHKDDRAFDSDSLLVETECTKFQYYAIGRGVMPHILVEDWDAGRIPVGTKKCNSVETNSLKITNTGTDILTVTGVELSDITPPFTLSAPTQPEFPFTIAPGASVFLKTICYEPTQSGNNSIDVDFVSDADPNDASNDSRSKWIGSSGEPGPYVSNWDFGAIRVGTTTRGKVFVKNSGTDAASLTNVTEFDIEDLNLEITTVDRDPRNAAPVSILGNDKDSVTIDALFHPQAELSYTDSAVCHFTHLGKNFTISGYLKGSGFLEKIDTTSAKFPLILVGTQVTSTTTSEFVQFKNISTSAQLKVHSYEIVPGQADADQFEFVNAPQSNLTLPIGSDWQQIAFRYKPTRVGTHRIAVRIYHNAEDPIANPTGTTSAIVYVEGSAFQTGVGIGDHDYGNVLTCDRPTGYITVTNPTPGTPVRIDTMYLTGADATMFEIDPAAIAQLPILVDNGNPYRIPVIFKLNDNPNDRNYNATVIVRTNVPNADDSVGVLTATGYKVSADFKLVDENGNASTSFDNYTNAKTWKVIFGGTSTTWNLVGVDKLRATVSFANKHFDFDKVKLAIDNEAFQDNSWRVQVYSDSVVTENGGEMRKITFELSGSTPIARNGKMFNFELLPLSSSDYGKMSLSLDVDVLDRFKCVNTTTKGNEISLNYCVDNFRVLDIGTYFFALRAPNPNPVPRGKAHISFAVGYDAQTSIELVNSAGDVVKTLLNQPLKAGEHELQLNDQQLAGGSYIIRMKSGHVTKTQTLVLE